MLRKIILGVIFIGLVGFVALQFVGNFVPAFARTNPPVTYQIQWNSSETESLMRTACYDCHSNETVWPWYSSIAPVSWLVARDVNEGREVLNFSTGEGELEGEDMVNEILEGEMPPNIYLTMHPAANLTEDQRTQLIAGIEATFGGEDSEHEDEEDDD
jgi:hypothetical protein